LRPWSAPFWPTAARLRIHCRVPASDKPIRTRPRPACMAQHRCSSGRGGRSDL
jgi:hypothetical protein